MSSLSACSERCGWCGRCSGGVRRDRFAPFNAAEHRAIRHGLVSHGLSQDYFGFYDIDYLRKQGKTVEDVVDTAVQMETLAQRHAVKHG